MHPWFIGENLLNGLNRVSSHDWYAGRHACLLHSGCNLLGTALWHELRPCYRTKSIQIRFHFDHLGSGASDLLGKVLHIGAARSQRNFSMFSLSAQQSTRHLNIESIEARLVEISIDLVASRGR